MSATEVNEAETVPYYFVCNSKQNEIESFPQ